MLRQHFAVDDRREARGRVIEAMLAARSKISRHQLVERDLLQPAEIPGRNLQLVEHRPRGERRILARHHFDRRSTLYRGSVEQAARFGHREQRADFAAAAGLAEDHHATGIAAEALDVVAHPAQRLHDVEHADVAGVRELRAAEVAEEREAHDVETMIDRHDDDVAARQRLVPS